MGLYKKIFLIIIIIITVTFIVINTRAWTFFEKPIDLGMTETAVIQKISFDSTNNNTLLLDVQSMCTKDIVFNTAVIKDPEQHTVATIVSFETKLLAEKNVTVPVDLSGTKLFSGNYTVNLWTTRSHYFPSPPFTIR